ncbi:acyltransferase family protein [Falsiroseomonas sp.]|uniref:acyltransferase family protein n=1 Tax=Falsiroseomonas sp. TaxID=2870721 RepID=UPI003568392F
MDVASRARQGAGTLDYIQGLRAVAALVVVLFHIGAAERQLNVANPAFGILHYFGFGGVNLFFVISGFIITYAHHRQIGEARSAPGFVVRRLVRLMPVYWICWLGALAISYLIFREPYCAPGNVFWQPVANLLLTFGTTNCYIPQAWSLSWEMVFYAVFVVFFFLPRPLFIPAVTSWAALMVLANGFGNGGAATALLNVLCLQFLFGIAAARLVLNGRCRFSRASMLLGLGWFAAGGWLNAAGVTSTEDNLHRVLLFGAASFFLVYGAAAWNLARPARAPRLVALLGDASYAIYLVHITLIIIINRAFFVPGLPAAAQALFVIATALACTVAGAVVYLGIERPLLRGMRGSRHPAVALGAIALMFLGTVGAAALVTGSMDQAFHSAPPTYPVSGRMEEQDGRTTVTLNGRELRLVPEDQGWASRVERGADGSLRLAGWAVDRERSMTAIAVVAFIDGVAVHGAVPLTDFPLPWRHGFAEGRRAGFDFVLPAELLRGRTQLRLMALFAGDRIGVVRTRGEVTLAGG